MSITKLDYLKAAWQVFYLLIIELIGGFIGLFVVPIAILFRTKGVPSKFGELTQEHSEHYKSEGSSGMWEFENAPRWLWYWGNDEDGYLGEPSGKHSARNEGKERSFAAMYDWAALRNFFNNAKRYTSLMGCLVEHVDIEWIGEGVHKNSKGHVLLEDDAPLKEGWYFVKGTHRQTGRVYYNYRLVKRRKNGKIMHIRGGFKIKPSHIGQVMDADDKHKGFTARITLWANAN